MRTEVEVGFISSGYFDYVTTLLEFVQNKPFSVRSEHVYSYPHLSPILSSKKRSLDSVFFFDVYSSISVEEYYQRSIKIVAICKLQNLYLTTVIGMSSVHSIIGKYDYESDLNDLKILLKHDASSINDLNYDGCSPLHRLLKDKKRSIEVIKCLLYYGANPNCVGKGNANYHPVLLSLRHRREEDVVRTLLEAGAQVGGIYDREGHSPLCIALRYNYSADLVQMFLEGGCSPKKRVNHLSALHCSMFYEESKLRTNICKLLIGKDASFVFHDGKQSRSFMCYVLSHDAEPEAINLLLEAGCSLNACQVHYSAIGCATDHTGVLRTSVVQLLLDAGVKVGHVKKNSEIGQDTLMHKVLESLNCEIDTIKLLYHCENDVFPNGWPTSGLLRSAVKNLHCKPKVLQFLIDHGADVAEGEYLDKSILHLAVENSNCQPAVIEILMRNGCSANRASSGVQQFTALKEAFDKGRHSNVIVELLKGGARLAAAGNISDILIKALKQYSTKPCQENINFVKTLLKYALLENPKFDIRVLVLGRKHYSLFSNFNKECIQEIKILKSTNIFQFIGRHSDYKPKAKGNQLLKVPSMYTFSVYFDDICRTYGREAMEMRLLVQPIYCISDSSNSHARKVILNHDIARKIVGLLVDKDFFSLVVALFNSDKSIYAKGNKRKAKQGSEEPAKLRKRTRR